MARPQRWCLSLGTYPVVTLKAARTAALDAPVAWQAGSCLLPSRSRWCWLWGPPWGHDCWNGRTPANAPAIFFWRLTGEGDRRIRTWGYRAAAWSLEHLEPADLRS